MLAFRSVVSVLLRALGDFLCTLKPRPAGGRLRRPSSAARPGQPTYRVSRQPTAIEEGRDLSSMSGIQADSSYRLLPV
jgi:hypothetical protein